MTKTTEIYYTRKIGLILGPYVKLASNISYAQDISNEIDLKNRLIEFKKEYNYEKDVRSKMLCML